ncbi:levansucrase [Sphingomonas sp. Root710]|uniref:glycoside hydrolase family 68 protein n=1 Tax=Sphingomonas sp. Root710 TaxID=1736594 RepID=UPI0006F1D4B3|nr:glycoside hydrolase family 68 protein [Sphingomonas sp. Root710]KRB86781.1 levansucrase [Sphingomonas sp. Root710]
MRTIEPYHWSPADVARIDAGSAAAPLIGSNAVAPPVAGLDLWDHWPVLEEDGAIARIAGGTMVIALSAPMAGDPEERHALARLRLFHTRDDGWRDLGNLLPDGFSPGSREWAGSATVDPRHDRLTLHFTAAGFRGEAEPSFAQRIFMTSAALVASGPAPTLSGWTAPAETVTPDGAIYETDMAGGGAAGTIKAFRDPFIWRDPADGVDYLLFTASRAEAASRWNGLVGLARREGADWSLQRPLVDATGLNNELERPHIIVVADRRYLFWSTQAKVFAEGGPAGPTGLYGLVADDIAGPWCPLNGSGLVFANPPAAPFQAYSWQVLKDGSVWSFADLVGLSHPPVDTAEARAHFGGAPAPILQLRFDGERVMLIQPRS